MIETSQIYIFQSKIQKSKKIRNFYKFFELNFSHFSVPLHFQHKISGTSFHLINKNVTENDSHERLVSNEWSNVANKIFYHKKIFSPVNGTFPIFPIFLTLDYTVFKDPFPCYLDIFRVIYEPCLAPKIPEKPESRCF